MTGTMIHLKASETFQTFIFFIRINFFLAFWAVIWILNILIHSLSFSWFWHTSFFVSIFTWFWTRCISINLCNLFATSLWLL